MKLFARALAVATGLAVAAVNGAPTPKDFAAGLIVEDAPGAPAQQFTVPEAVYQGVTRPDLGDLRVFNGGDVVVPHALCTAPETLPPTVREQELPVFPLQRVQAQQQQQPRMAAAQTDVIVRTPGGTQVQVLQSPQVAGSAITPGAPGTPAGPETFVVDASAVAEPLRALRLAWSTPDGASEAFVRVEASDDLNSWRPIVAGTTLLHVAADGRELERSHIDLPEARYRYLRLVRNEGPALAIRGVMADVVHPGSTAAPLWFAAMPAADAGGGGFVFDAGRLAPVHAARVVLPVANMNLRVDLHSRRSPEEPWQLRWDGEIQSAEAVADNAIGAVFAPTADPLWRVTVRRGAETLGRTRLTLRLGYYPARLQFLAQGEGPYRVAYGSTRVPPAETLGCDGLLPGGNRELVGMATVAPAPAAQFGGAGMLAPPPKPTPVRQIVLWAVLLAGTGAIVAMALALLKRLRAGGAP
jgi:hypothetical protein